MRLPALNQLRSVAVTAPSTIAQMTATILDLTEQMEAIQSAEHDIAQASKAIYTLQNLHEIEKTVNFRGVEASTESLFPGMPLNDLRPTTEGFFDTVKEFLQSAVKKIIEFLEKFLPMKRNFEAELLVKDAEIDKLKHHVNDLVQRIADSDVAFNTALSDLASGNEAKVAELSEELTRRSDEVTQLAAMHERAIGKKNEALQALGREKAEMRAAMVDLKRELSATKNVSAGKDAEIAKLKDKHTKELADAGADKASLAEKHKTEVDALNAQHDAVIAGHEHNNAKLVAAKARLSEALRKEIATAKMVKAEVKTADELVSQTLANTKITGYSKEDFDKYLGYIVMYADKVTKALIGISSKTPTDADPLIIELQKATSNAAGHHNFAGTTEGTISSFGFDAKAISPFIKVSQSVDSHQEKLKEALKKASDFFLHTPPTAADSPNYHHTIRQFKTLTAIAHHMTAVSSGITRQLGTMIDAVTAAIK